MILSCDTSHHNATVKVSCDIVKPIDTMHELHSRLCLMNTRQELIEQLLHRILCLIETILENIQRATGSHHNGRVT